MAGKNEMKVNQKMNTIIHDKTCFVAIVATNKF